MLVTRSFLDYILRMKARGITAERWQKAQEFERKEWQNLEPLLHSEWNEIEQKLSPLFSAIAQEIGLQEHSRVLDVGSGATVPARLLGKGTITGLEPLARELGITGKEREPAVEMVSAKAEHMPFPDNVFDCVVCRNVIDHTQDPRAVVQEIHRVLKDGSCLILICYTYAPFVTWVKNTSERLNIVRNVGHPHTFTPDMLDDVVAGLFNIQKRYTIHTGKHSTDYGKAHQMQPDRSFLHQAVIQTNALVFRSPWFLKEYGFLARKI